MGRAAHLRPARDPRLKPACRLLATLALAAWASPASAAPLAEAALPAPAPPRPAVAVVASPTTLARAAPAPAPTDALAGKLAKALAVPHVSAARSAAVAVDLQTGAVVFGRNRSLPLAPASTEKLALSLAFLSRLGPAYRIETRVVGSGALAPGGVWRGDLVLQGAGDPTLSRAVLRALASQVRSRGVRIVTGRVVGDESFFDTRRTAPGWKAGYFIEESPPLSALVVDRSRYGGRTSTQPALAAALLFREALRGAGIATDGGAAVGTAPTEDALLARRLSAPAQTLLRAVNARSDNFTAEMLLKHLGAVERGQGTTGAGAAVVTEVLRDAGVPLAGVRVVDASGLSLLDRQTADALASILVLAWNDPLLRGSFLSTLAVAGRTGTLRDRLRAPAVAGNVWAKTGTTSRASALAGFVGGRYAFAVVQNGSPIASWWARYAQDRFVSVLARG
jgi:D-alanyl-D-alanine carboxypeptidase/D-alanyl-D-alanine-endopeptidase (penicillin-binding protein 4)